MSHPFGVYVHVPFCASRCGYCAFNTYTAADLGGTDDARTYVDTAQREIRLARATVGPRAVHSVFFGGGTPTLLPAGELLQLLDTIGAEFGFEPDVELTVEANPDSIDGDGLRELRAGGVTRLSFGMQSVRPHVLAVLERSHTPGRTQQVVREARAAGIDHINVDVIYGTPGESDDDWDATIDEVLAMEVDHLSAYALTLEAGTRLAAQVRQGRVPPLDEDALARRYERFDAALSAGGFHWYELSNWARSPEARCRHNLLYWRGDDWWGIGPGAHSHLDGRRWRNVNHPREYAARVADGGSPETDVEVLDPAARRLETVMTGLRLAEGLPLAPAGIDPVRVAALARDGLVVQGDGRVRLTLLGRQLADHVVRRLGDFGDA